MKNIDSRLISNLPAYGENGEVHAIVEAPKGTSVKPKYDPKLGVFTISRALPLGLSYPFDWGFVPSTQARDGDPLDVLILHDEKTWPGVLLECQPLGVVEMDQDDQHDKRERNDRVIVMPSWHDRLAEFQRASELPKRLREEIEQFFLSTDFFTAKTPKILGWKGRKRASDVIRKANEVFLLASGQLSPQEEPAQ